jgi:7-carboxy-7-deazaguanine synthase
MAKIYSINEIFYSLQGEGARAGSANVFVRFSGCNLQCDIEPGPLSPGGFACDTEFTSSRKITAAEIIAEAIRLAPQCKAVIFTGGEPALQLDAELVRAFTEQGYYLAVETNGTKPLPAGIHWVCVSPKTAEHTLCAGVADELKYVRHVGQSIPRPSLDAVHKFISPAWSPEGLKQADLEWCIKLVLENPDWSLSWQAHKLWRIR